MLELKNISYRVSETLPSGALRETDILKDVNLTIDDRFVAITGPNGSGKSTLAKIIAGIITPTEGRIYLDGEDITDLSITERANKGISFAFQHGQGPHLPGRREEALHGRGLRILGRGWSLRQGIRGPRGQRIPVRR